MHNNRRRNFRGRQQKNGFRRRPTSTHASNGHFSNNNIGNKNFNRNGSLSNPSSIEKIISKFQQLAKDAQSSGDPVLIENYLQHAEHYSRKLAEINHKSQPSLNSEDQSINKENQENKKI
jgi:hypothetical protein